MKILLCGNPNVGKTTLFNALTGANNKTGNYHGITVGTSERPCKYRKNTILFDLPGMYSFSGFSLEELNSAESLIHKEENSLVVQVVDPRYLIQSLKLTKSLMDKGIHPILAMNMMKKFRQKRGSVDLKRLSEFLGLSCLEVEATEKSSVKAFLKKIESIQIEKKAITFQENIGKKLKSEGIYQEITRKKPNFIYKEQFAVPIFLILTGIIFYLTFGKGMPGVVLKEILEKSIEKIAQTCSQKINSLFVKILFCDGLLYGVGSVFSFIPQLALLYLFLDIMEESGFMSILAYATDGFFSLFGLTGKSAFSIILGFGCSAAAISSTRASEDKQAQKRTISCIYFIPCSAKLPVFLLIMSSVFSSTFWGAVILYVLGTGMGLAVSSFFQDEDDNFLTETTEISFPPLIFIVKKLLFQLKQFIIKVSTVVLAFTLLVRLLSCLSFQGVCAIEDSFLAQFCGVIKYLFYPMGIKDFRAAFAALSGLIAKENIASMMTSFFPQGLSFSYASTAAYLTFIALMPPCVSAITACGRELGMKTAWKYAGAQIIFAFVCAYAIYFLLGIGSLVVFTIIVLFAIAVLCIQIITRKRKHEKIYGIGKRKVKRFYG